MKSSGGILKNIGSLTNIIAIFLLAIPLILAGRSDSGEIGVIKNPRPTMVEKHYTQLVKVGEIKEELGNDEFLFYPLSWSADRFGNLYIYDRYQSQVIKLNKDLKYVTSIGRWGFGPGEIITKGRLGMVFINVGIDDRLYVNDNKGFKVSIFELDGTFVRQYRYRKLKFLKPIADKDGNLITYDGQNGILKIHNEKKVTLFEYPYKSNNKISHLFHKPLSPQSRIKIVESFPLSAFQMYILIRRDSTLLLYFSSSSILYVIEEGKATREIKVWPKEALKHFKEDVEIKSKMKIHKYRMFRLFNRIFLDGDNEDILYLHQGKVEEKKMNCLYKINLMGKLLDVLYVKVGDKTPSITFRVKKNGLFYGRQDEKIVIYKEVTQ
jgi:hypothetical protein